MRPLRWIEASAVNPGILMESFLPKRNLSNYWAGAGTSLFPFAKDRDTETPPMGTHCSRPALACPSWPGPHRKKHCSGDPPPSKHEEKHQPTGSPPPKTRRWATTAGL